MIASRDLSRGHVDCEATARDTQGQWLGVEKDGARRRTCVISATCQSKPHSSELVRRNALAGLRQHKQASSSAKRLITFARASTAHDRRNRRSRSGCRRRAKRASIFPRRRRGRHPNALAAQRNEPCARGAAAGRRRLHRVRAPRVTRSSERVARLPQRRRSRDRRAAARGSVRRRLAVHRPGRRRGRRDQPFVVLPPSVPRPRVDAGRKPEKGRPEAPGPEFGTGRALRSAVLATSQSVVASEGTSRGLK